MKIEITEPLSPEHAALKSSMPRTEGQEIALAVHEVANAVRSLTRWLTVGNATSGDGHGALENVVASLEDMKDIMGALTEAGIAIAANTRKPARRKVRGPSRKKLSRRKKT